MARLKDLYAEKIIPAMINSFKYKNKSQVPRLEKIIVSMGLGKSITEKKLLETAIKEVTRITGQKPVICKAKKSVSNFKLREGLDIGLKVTLRELRMYEFLERLICLAIPRVRDFRGLNPKGFDGRGNFNMGLTEIAVFPEVNPAELTIPLGLNIAMVSSAVNDEEGRQLLGLFGMPFQTEQESTN
ncbi:MAG: 50S ribosomal protein L5 [Planctomycetes bacterium]|nr:50S ribosomal protein L5 [Planctomycetota bacterium]